jgi:1-acyl-sn-glycerol-3-phosphate acyltransferase
LIEKTWYWAGRMLVGLFAHTMLRLSVEWKAPLPGGPVILAANHPSTIDPAILTMLSPAQVTILILDTLFKVPLFGRSLRLCGHIPVVSGNGQAALDKARRLVEAGRTVAIFPEGKISPQDGDCHQPHTGLARLALLTGVPVVPVGIGLDPVQIQTIETRVDGKPALGTWYFHGPYALTVGQAVTFQGDVENRERVRQVSCQLMHTISQLKAESTWRIQAAMPAPRLRPAIPWALWLLPLHLVQNFYMGVKATLIG